MGSHESTASQEVNGSGSQSTKQKSGPQQSIPSGFRMSGGAKELHGHPIYCLSWSTDVYENLGPSGEEQRVDKECAHSNVGSEASVSTSNDDTESVKEATNQNERKSSFLVRCLATCGGNQVTVYEVDVPENSLSRCREGLILRQSYVDTDESEVFFACAFGGRSLGRHFGYAPIEPHVVDSTNRTILPRDGNFFTNLLKKKRPRSEMSADDSRATNNNECDRRQLFQEMAHLEKFDGPQLLCVAGKRGVIKVIDTVRRMLFVTLSGHGDEIYDIKFSPTNEWLLLSASKDESLRMWNVKTATCVAIFAGHEGHRDSVLSLGWHPKGNKFASGGMDTTIKLWSIEDDDEVGLAIQRSGTVQTRPKDPTLEGSCDQVESFRTVYAQMPYFSSNKVHTDYIDCVQFVGDLVLSKSVSNTIVLWMPDLSKSSHRGSKSAQRLPNAIVSLRAFPLSKCDVWFIRFQTDIDCRLLAIGNNIGEIRLWEIGPSPSKKHFCTLTQQHCCSTVRMVSFSPDGKCLVASCDDATLWKWDAV